MRVLVVNPNTTAIMTDTVRAAAEAAAPAGCEVVAREPADGPASIEGYYDEAFAVPGALREVARGEAEGFDAHVVACFDDTGLDAARSIARAPVIGIGEAAFHAASLIAHRFAVVTTLSRSVAPIEHNLVRYGLAARCAGVTACEVPVLALHDRASDARARVSAECGAALGRGADAIVLGCAGMADLAAELAAEHGVPVVDGVAAAVRLAHAVAGMGLVTSKLGPYAAPRPKPYAGAFSADAPGEAAAALGNAS